MADEPELLRYVSEPYSRVLVPDPSGGYFAEILELPGCFAQGDTPDEAITNLNEAMEGWFETALAEGQSIPPPLATAGYSGRVLLRLPKSLHKAAARRAEVEGVSLNQYLVAAVAAYVEGHDVAERITRRLFGNVSIQVLAQFQVDNTSGQAQPRQIGPIPREELQEGDSAADPIPWPVARKEHRYA